MNRRDFVVGGVTGTVGLVTGIAVSPKGCKLSGSPLEELHKYLCAFHVDKEDPKKQVIAHHYCMEVNSEFFQCVILDSNKVGAKLIGIEYVISKRLYDAMPVDEQKFWHPHSYEVDSGLLTAPNLPLPEEDKLMTKLRLTYGKTFHTWTDTTKDIPFGEPRLQWAFTADRQVDEALVSKRDKELNINTASIRRGRETKRRFQR